MHIKKTWTICKKCKETFLFKGLDSCLACQGKYTQFNQPDSIENVKKYERSKSSLASFDSVDFFFIGSRDRNK